MFQTAIFVDAGYLYAQGSALLAGRKQPRTAVRLNVPLMIADLFEEARAVEPDGRLLRAYWYDGLARGGSPSIEQRTLATFANVKCRFGTVNSQGEQKGVDSLIVTDLIELARGQAISDALILSGDEDIRVGVQVAQSFGIRVHLLGIEPSRGSQSPDLLAEADTIREWGRAKVGTWLAVQAKADAAAIATAAGEPMRAVIVEQLAGLSAEDARQICKFADDNRNQLPADFDRPSLGIAKVRLGRPLSDQERRQFRLDILTALRTHGQRSQ